MTKKICVIGLGNVGYPTAEYVSKQGFEVYGFDIQRIKTNGFFTTTQWEEIPQDVVAYVITVPTGWRTDQPDLSALFDTCSRISHTNVDALICIESTVPIYTCQKLAKEFKFKYLVHVPHRFWAGDSKNHGVKQLRILGALNKESLLAGWSFYKQLDIPVHVVLNIETAEACKIVENSYRFVQIALTEEISAICNSLLLDYNEVRKGCNTKWNVQLLEARDGIFGECLPKDIRYLLGNAKLAPLLQGAIETDKLYKKLIKKCIKPLKLISRV